MAEQFDVVTQGKKNVGTQEGLSNSSQPKPKSKNFLLILILLLISVGGAVGGLFYLLRWQKSGSGQKPIPTIQVGKIELEQFASDEEFKNYLAEYQGALFGDYPAMGLDIGAPLTRVDTSLQSLQEAPPGGIPTK